MDDDRNLMTRDQDNPYATPEHQPEAQRKAYSLAQVLWATFFAGVFATAFMARNNHLAFKEPRRATISFWLFLGIGMMMLAAGFFLPSTSYLVDFAISIITVFAAGVWYNQTMRESFDDYTHGAGRQASHWQTVGVIVMCLIGMIALSALVFAICDATEFELPE